MIALSPPLALARARSFRRASCLLVALAAACGENGGSGAARGDTTQIARGGAGKTIAAVLPTRQGEFWQQFESGLKEAAERGGYELRVELAELDTARERTIVQSVIKDGADALMLVPSNAAAAAPLVASAAAAKIPVFTAGTAIPGARVVSHVASDDEAGGELAATYIATFMRGGGEAAIVGLPGTPAGDARERGFRRKLEGQRALTIVTTVSGGGTRESARAATEALMAEHPRIDAIFVTSEAQTLGVLDATRERWQELVVVGYGFPAEVEQAIAQESPLKASIREAPREMGIRAVQVIAEHLSNEGVPPRLAVGVRLMSAGNIEAGKR
jgi:ribose transport system substrate-binding protein